MDTASLPATTYRASSRAKNLAQLDYMRKKTRIISLSRHEPIGKELKLRSGGGNAGGKRPDRNLARALDKQNKTKEYGKTIEKR